MNPHAALALVGHRTAAEHHAAGRAIELRNGDHHGGLDRVQAALGVFPLLQRLEFDGLGGEIGHIEARQHVLGGARIIVGGAAHQREARQRDQRVDCWLAVLHEKALDRRALVEARGEGGDHFQPARLEGGDHAIIMRGVARQHVGAHQQQADRALGAGRLRGQGVRPFAHPSAQARVIDAHFRIGLGLAEGDALQVLARAIGEFRNEEAHQLADVLFRTRQPVLHRKEIGPHVLCRARNEAQDLGQPLQHGKLLFAGRGLLGVLVGLGAAQLLQQVDDDALAAAHDEAAHAGELDHLASRHEAYHGIAAVAPRGECGQHRLDVILHEQHGGDDDVALADILDAGRERIGVGAPVRCGMDGEGEARHVAGELGIDAGHRPRDVVVEGDDHHMGCRPIGCSVLWHHTASRL